MPVSKHALAASYTKIAANTRKLGSVQSPSAPGLTLPQQAAIMAAPLVMGKVIDLSVAAVNKVREVANKSRAYKEMLEVNPHLQGGDAITVQRYFNTLHRMNPGFAEDPIIAGSFVSNQLGLHTPNRPHAGMFEAARQLATVSRSGPAGPSAGEQITRYLVDVQGAASRDLVRDMQQQVRDARVEMRDTRQQMQEQVQAANKRVQDLEQRRRVIADHYRKMKARGVGP
jgi:hypothetical protein